MINKNERSVNKWNTVSYVVVSVINFLIFSFAFRIFESDKVGLYVLLMSVFLLGGNLDLGFGISTIKQIAAANKQNNNNYIREYFFTFLFTYLVLVIIILILQYVYFIIFIKNLTTINLDSDTVTNIYILLSVNFAFTFLYNYFRCFLEGMFQYIFISKILISLNILNLFLAFYAAFYANDFIIFVAVGLVISSIMFLIYLLKIFITLKTFFKYEYLNISLVKENIKYSSKLQISFFIGNSIDYLIKFIITIFLSIGFVAIYESGKKCISFINGFIFSTQKILLVKLSEVKPDKKINFNENPEVLKYSDLAVKLTFLFYAFLNPAICIFLYYWFKNIESVIVFLLLALPQTLISFLIPLYNVIIIEGKKHYLITMQFLNVFLIAILTALWFYLFQSFIGLLGYYIATILNSIIVLNYFKKYHLFSPVSFLKKINYVKIIILSILLIAELTLINSGINFNITILCFQIIFIILFYKDLIFLINKLRIKRLN